MLLIPFEQALKTLTAILSGVGFNQEDAAQLADVFARNTLEGVASHGLNRFPRFVKSVEDGSVKPGACPEAVGALGGFEIWDGHYAAGPIVAAGAMDRACRLAHANGVACVAVRCSNHWQRAGRYAWQAVGQGMIGLCWTNTSENMPAWGAMDARLGNNPLAVGLPRQKGAVVVDLSMSQFAYGRLEIAAQNGERLPVAGGFDTRGSLTDDPGEIIKTARPLPIGMWKGSALSLVLDMLAAGLSMGRTVHQIGGMGGSEAGLSQVYIAIRADGLGHEAAVQARFDDAVEALLQSRPAAASQPIRYPSQNMAATIAKNMKNGLPVNEKTWNAIENLRSTKR